jgi:hypothetical protein
MIADLPNTGTDRLEASTSAVAEANAFLSSLQFGSLEFGSPAHMQRANGNVSSPAPMAQGTQKPIPGQGVRGGQPGRAPLLAFGSHLPPSPAITPSMAASAPKVHL